MCCSINEREINILPIYLTRFTQHTELQLTPPRAYLSHIFRVTFKGKRIVKCSAYAGNTELGFLLANGKGKSKFVPVLLLTEHHAVKAYWEMEV
jgi:hypothetical protein